nr:MAG TPA: hypothetical protein [Caudoviricetes sp.]
MIDAESTIFDRVADAFDEAYPNGSRYGEETTSPPRFPCLTLVQVDNFTYEPSLDAANKEHNAWLVFEANVYSNKTAGAKQECKDIMQLVDEQMQSLNFVRLFCTPSKNADKKYFRMTARYRAVISEEYRLYRT